MNIHLVAQVVWVTFTVLFPVYYLYTRWEDARVRQAVQENKRESILQEAPEAQLFPVKICSEACYGQLYTFTPWDGAGFVVLAHASAWLEGSMADGSPVRLDLTAIPTRWLNRERWYAHGSMAFFSLGDSPHRLMVGFDTGWLQYGVVKRTKILLRELRDRQEEIRKGA